MTGAPIADNWLYEPDAVDVGILLFGARVCSGCGAKLPACSDYFTKDKSVTRGFKSACRRCIARRSRERYARDPRKKIAMDRAHRARKAACS